jgi:hypothetical protein
VVWEAGKVGQAPFAAVIACVILTCAPAMPVLSVKSSNGRRKVAALSNKQRYLLRISIFLTRLWMGGLKRLDLRIDHNWAQTVPERPPGFRLSKDEQLDRHNTTTTLVAAHCAVAR